MGGVEGGGAEPWAAVGAENTKRVTEAWLLPWSVWGGGRGQGSLRDLCRHVAEDPVAREPERTLIQTQEGSFPEAGSGPWVQNLYCLPEVEALSRSFGGGGGAHRQPCWRSFKTTGCGGEFGAPRLRAV